jgi:hypothetical protein
MSIVLLILFVLILTVGYAARCWLKPFTTCNRCNGTKTVKGSILDQLIRGQAERPCPRCNGTGLRLRIGRLVYNHLTRVRRAAS